MAGNKNIYIVYDAKIEDSASLSKLLGIVLEKAKYPIKSVEFVTIDQYLKILETNGLQRFTICLNKTYSEISLRIGSLLEEPPFKFFSRTYNNPEKHVFLLGLLMDISTIFTDDATKKNAWVKLVAFHKLYEENSSSLLDEPVEEIIKDVPVVNEPVVVEEVKVQKKLKIQDTLPNSDKPSYEDLLNFYNTSKRILLDVDSLKTIIKKLG